MSRGRGKGIGWFGGYVVSVPPGVPRSDLGLMFTLHHLPESAIFLHLLALSANKAGQDLQESAASPRLSESTVNVTAWSYLIN